MQHRHLTISAISAALLVTLFTAVVPTPSLSQNMAMIGKPAPNFTLKDLSGKTVRLSAYKGKPVLLEFWATWCADCRETLPHLEKMHAAYASSGLAVMAVSVDTKQKKVKPFLEKNKYTLPVLLDDGKTRTLYGVQRIPTLLLIDRKGIVRSVYVEYGEKGAARIEADLRNLLTK